MEISELETLESKIRTILKTLEGLEKEVAQYQQKNMSIVAAFEALKNATEEVAAAGKGLSEAAEILRTGDLAEALKAVDARINQLEESKTAIEDQASAIEAVAGQVLAGLEQLGTDISSLGQHMPMLKEVRHMIAGMVESMKAIENKINRIDQNTQKGFFKIRG